MALALLISAPWLSNGLNAKRLNADAGAIEECPVAARTRRPLRVSRHPASIINGGRGDPVAEISEIVVRVQAGSEKDWTGAVSSRPGAVSYREKIYHSCHIPAARLDDADADQKGLSSSILVTTSRIFCYSL